MINSRKFFSGIKNCLYIYMYMYLHMEKLNFHFFSRLLYCGRTRKISSNLGLQRPTLTCRIFVSRGIPLLIDILILSFMLMNILSEIIAGL